MFRKPVHLSGEHAVSGADRKKLRRALAAAFSADDATLDALLPPKADLRVAKLSPPSRASLYTQDGAPWLLDRSGRGDWLPALPALWAAPALLPRLTLRDAEVSRFLLGGADLMLPGVALSGSDLGTLRQGDLAAVFAPGNPAALAVGVVALSGAEAAARGGKGRLMEVAHVFGDCLWALTPPAAATPNAGFTRQAVAPLPGYEEAEGPPSDWEDGDDDGDEDTPKDEDAPPVDDAPLPHLPADEAAPPPPPALASAAETDALLDLALLQALKLRISDGELPLSASTAWAQHVLPSRPAGATVDVRRSSHRKVSAFVAAKAAQGWLSAKEDKRSGELVITGVNRRHPALLAHTPHAAADAEENAAGVAAASSSMNDASAAPPPLHIEELVVPSAATKAIFAAVGVADAALGEKAATEALWAYCGANCTGTPSQAGAVVLDPQLCDALYNGVLKKGEPAPTELLRPALAAAFLARCARGRRVWRGSGGPPVPPPPLQRGALPPLHLAIANRAGGKKVTLVRGFEAYCIEAESLAAQLKERFAAACAVAELPRAEGAAGGSRAVPPAELTLQGDKAVALASLLEQRWGVPRRCIVVPAGAAKDKAKGGKH
jgi:translation initiation factor 2D